MKSEFKVGDRVINTFCEKEHKGVMVKQLAETYKESFAQNIGTVIQILSEKPAGVWVKFDREFKGGNSGPNYNDGSRSHFFFIRGKNASVDGFIWLEKVNIYSWKKL